MNNFITEIIDNDIKNNGVKPLFRFPPEPGTVDAYDDGGLHIGHAKSLFLNFGLAEKYNTKCNLRFDDTNPITTKQSYVDNIIKEIEWLGLKPSKVLYVSDYFEKLYDYALELIKKDKAYVCELSAEKIKEDRTTPTEKGVKSPYSKRTVSENLEAFEKMKNGELNAVLRANIDMDSPNMHLRDPILYRVIKHPHYRTGNKWKIYPTYDFAHPLSDAIEGISHSICTLEFEVHRPLYNWIINNLIKDNKPKQIEFARLNISNNIISKRKIANLINKGLLEQGWTDPRILTLKALKRKGYTPESIKEFCNKIGVTKRETVIENSLLEDCIRNELNDKARRFMGVLDPLEVEIINWEGEDEMLEYKLPNNDESHKMKFGKSLYIEKEDFRKEANRKFKRLKLGKEVRLKGAYVIKAENVVEDENGEIVKVLCTYDPKSKSGNELDRKVKGVINWVNINDNLTKLYFKSKPFIDDNGEVITDKNTLECNYMYLEPDVKKIKNGEVVQLIRKGYYKKENNGIVFHFIETVGMKVWKPKK